MPRLALFSNIKNCPFTIFAATHYRPDGTCKCDDQKERDRMIRHWGYRPEHFKDIPLRKDSD
jgi:hypothetical protein